MTVVLDASVLVAALTDAGPDGTWSESVIAAGSLAAPMLILVEAANVLRRLERANDITSLEAGSAYRDTLRLDLEFFPYEPFAARIWELRQNLSSYDAWYVALAEQLRCPLATLDARLSRASGPTCEILIR